MIADRSQVEGQTFDFCIIGSGAIGIALATRLAKTKRRILLLEAGTPEITARSQEFYCCETAGHPHHGSSNARFRVFGGSTEKWGGQAMRFDPIDLESRPWMNAPDWPVRHDQLSRHYAAAEIFMGVPDAPYDSFHQTFAEWSGKLGHRAEAIQAGLGPFHFHHSVFSHTPRLREKFATDLAAENILILQNTSATRLVTDGNGRVLQILARQHDKEIQLAAREFILATGGVENPRFLLLQKEFFQVPELASHQAIGRYFQDHPGIHLGEITGPGAALYQNAFRLKATAEMNLKGRISWSAQARRDGNRMAVSGTFLMSRRPSQFDDQNPPARTRLGNPADWFVAGQSLARGVAYSPLHYTVLAVSAEDARDAESRITLSVDRRDPAGLPAAVVDWKISPKVAESIVEFADCFERHYRAAKLGTFRRFACANSPATLAPELCDNAHHIGATTLGSSPDEAVVDENLKVFGFSNLHIAGTSTLPTGSHANPTLTALALAFRLAGDLAR